MLKKQQAAVNKCVTGGKGRKRGGRKSGGGDVLSLSANVTWSTLSCSPYDRINTIHSDYHCQAWHWTTCHLAALLPLVYRWVRACLSTCPSHHILLFSPPSQPHGSHFPSPEKNQMSRDWITVNHYLLASLKKRKDTDRLQSTRNSAARLRSRTGRRELIGPL